MSGLLLLLLGCAPRVDLPDLGPAPPFALTDQRGQPLSSQDLRGRVLVADFIFTRCPHACPMLTQSMAEVAEVLELTVPNVKTRLHRARLALRKRLADELLSPGGVG